MNKENLFVGGGVLAAAASSLCCILPLTAALFGAGSLGAASVLESFRPYLLAFAFIALASGLYLAYFRRRDCGEDEICTAGPVSRASRVFLWAGTLVVLASALAPYYAGYLAAGLPSGSGATKAAAASETDNQAIKTAVIDIEGMTCEGCAVHISETLRRLDGVVSAEASYPKKNAAVAYDPARVTLEQIRKAIDDIGYRAK